MVILLAGSCGNTICICTNYVLLTHCICDGELSMDISKVLLVFLNHILLVPLLHLLRNDDGLNHTEPPLGSHLCIGFLCTLYTLLRLLYTQTSKLFPIFARKIYRFYYRMEVGFWILTRFSHLGLFQQIPKWWIWYYWICPVAWTVYGLIVSQYGDVEDTIKVPGIDPDPSIKWYVENHFGYDLNFMGPVAVVLIGFTVFFASLFAFCIKTMNFQQR